MKSPDTKESQLEVRLAILGFTDEPRTIDRLLNVTSSEVKLGKDPFPLGTITRRNYWAVSSGIQSLTLTEHIEVLLEKCVELPKLKQLAEGWSAHIHCRISFGERKDSIELSLKADTIARLAANGLDLDFDVYFAN